MLRDGLYLRLARHANMMADRLRQGLADLGISVLSDSTTNQIFPILAASDAAKLREQCDFEIIEPMNNNRVCIRFVTSFSVSKAVEKPVVKLRQMGRMPHIIMASLPLQAGVALTFFLFPV